MLTRGSVLLARFLVREHETGTSFALRHKLRQSDVSAYVLGAKGPSRARSNLLAKATKGMIPTTAWDQAASEVEQRSHAKNVATLRARALGLARAAKVKLARAS